MDTLKYNLKITDSELNILPQDVSIDFDRKTVIKRSITTEDGKLIVDVSNFIPIKAILIRSTEKINVELGISSSKLLIEDMTELFLTSNGIDYLAVQDMSYSLVDVSIYIWCNTEE